ncbi:MAG: insulinase family protein [Myxococcota bacterium]
MAWPPVKPPQRPVEPAQVKTRSSPLGRDASGKPVWHWLGIYRVSHADIPAIDALSVVLGHGDSSILYQELRRKCSLVNDVYAPALILRVIQASYGGAGLKVGQARPAIAAILAQVFRLRHETVSSSELD